MKETTAIGAFAIRHRLAIAFISVALCLAGIYAAFRTPSSVFPQTNFPRVVILVDNGVMPADEMMATITRPIEEAMKDIPGAVTVRSTTGRGSAEISVFFNWRVDMIQSELYVNSRLSQIRSGLPATASTTVWRLTFSAFPIIGVSLTSPKRSITELWETARYEIKPRFLRIPGVARVDIVGGRTPEYHVVVDPVRLQAANLSLGQVTDALEKNNLIAPTGMHEENHTLYLAVVDGRVHGIEDIENLTVAVAGTHPIRIKDFARVERGPEPVFNVVTAEGMNAVLLNIRSQPDGSTQDRASAGHADRLLLRPIAVRPRVGAQCLGRYYLRPDPVGAHPLFLSEKLGHHAHRYHGHSIDRPHHARGDDAGRTELQPHDAGRHCGGNRAGH
jgi:multidrug efflux pump subunit AcrB